MKAKLFIRGMREPVELEFNEASAAQTLIASTSDPKTPFSIEGVIATKKEDMKFVVFDKEDKERHYAKQVEPMEESEARRFEPSVVFSKADAVARGYSEGYWPEFYMQKEKAIRLEFHGEGINKGIQVIVKDPDLFGRLQNKLDSFRLWKGRKEFAEKKELERLSIMEKELML